MKSSKSSKCAKLVKSAKFMRFAKLMEDDQAGQVFEYALEVRKAG